MTAFLGNLCLAFGLGIPVQLLRGLVLSWLWLWFLVPLGLPEIGFVQGAGLAVIATMLTANLFAKTTLDDDPSITPATRIIVSIMSVFYSLIVWLFGFLLQLFL